MVADDPRANLVGCTALWGRLSNIIGRRSAILLAFAFFTSGTLGCALAPSMNAILAARLIAGCGGGGFVPCRSSWSMKVGLTDRVRFCARLLTVTAIIISDLVSLKDRGLYQGYVNLLFGAGSASGALLGGWVSDKFGWRCAPLPLTSPWLTVLDIDRQSASQADFRLNSDGLLGCRSSLWLSRSP